MSPSLTTLTIVMADEEASRGRHHAWLKCLGGVEDSHQFVRSFEPRLPEHLKRHDISHPLSRIKKKHD